MTAGRGLPKSPAAATVTTSPRCIGIELGDGFYPRQSILFILGLQTRDLLRDALPDGVRTRIGHDETEFPQALLVSPLAHCLHSFGGWCHGCALLAVRSKSVTRYR